VLNNRIAQQPRRQAVMAITMQIADMQLNVNHQDVYTRVGLLGRVPGAEEVVLRLVAPANEIEMKETDRLAEAYRAAQPVQVVVGQDRRPVWQWRTELTAAVQAVPRGCRSDYRVIRDVLLGNQTKAERVAVLRALQVEQEAGAPPEEVDKVVDAALQMGSGLAVRTMNEVERLR
jgi:hypothetical protein